ncbi:MAG: MFS transporter [Alphaproteobacteria bacterium]
MTSEGDSSRDDQSPRSSFIRIAGAGTTFQAGSAAIDSATIMSALVLQLTGSVIAVGAVPAILRFGWLFPQFFVGYFASRSASSMRYYVVGAFGRAAVIAALAVVLAIGATWPALFLSVAVLGLWTLYAFVSGIVAVPYNDIVARAIPSDLRSRLLATRFLGGGILALFVAAAANSLIEQFSFPQSFAAVFALSAALMIVSSAIFVSIPEPVRPVAGRKSDQSFGQYFTKGINTYRSHATFRRFVHAQWCGGVVLMAMPFYVVQANQSGLNLDRIALLLGAQALGALLSNPLWGWWGDRIGKRSLMRAVTTGRMVPPALVLLTSIGGFEFGLLPVYAVVFFVLGALSNGLTIAVIGLLMEISPNDQRPAYAGYFNALTAPAFLLPFVGGFIVQFSGIVVVFGLSIVFAIAQTVLIGKLRTHQL